MGVVDQLVYGLSNAATLFVGARLLDVQDFGRFSLVYTAGIILLGLTRALTAETFAVRFSAACPEEQRRAGTAAWGASASLGMVLAIGAAGVGVAASSPEILALALGLPALVLQDHARQAMIARRWMREALRNDALWALVQFSTVGVLMATGATTPPLLLGAWALGAASGVVLATRQFAHVPDLRMARLWMRNHGQLGRTYAAEFAAVAGSGYSLAFIVAGTTGLVAAAAFRGGQALYGPLTMVDGGLRGVALPELARRRESGPEVLAHGVRVTSMGLAAIAVIAVGLLLALDDFFGPVLLGATWPGAAPLLVPLGAARIAASATAGPFLGLRLLEARRLSLSVRVAVAVAAVGSAIAGGHLGGALGAARGFAAVNVLGFVSWQIAFTRSIRRESVGLAGSVTEQNGALASPATGSRRELR